MDQGTAWELLQKHKRLKLHSSSSTQRLQKHSDVISTFPGLHQSGGNIIQNMSKESEKAQILTRKVNIYIYIIVRRGI